jgi:hypothetical protein
MTDDFTRAVMDCYLTATMKLAETPEDYQTAQDWEATGMPLTVALAGLQDKLDRSVGKPWFPHRMRLSWAADDVYETFASYKRALGPSWRG